MYERLEDLSPQEREVVIRSNVAGLQATGRVFLMFAFVLTLIFVGKAAVALAAILASRSYGAILLSTILILLARVLLWLKTYPKTAGYYAMAELGLGIATVFLFIDRPEFKDLEIQEQLKLSSADIIRAYLSIVAALYLMVRGCETWHKRYGVHFPLTQKRDPLHPPQRRGGA